MKKILTSISSVLFLFLFVLLPHVVGAQSTTGSISASPNPCVIPSESIVCSSTITWTSNASAVSVYVSDNGSSEQLFANSNGGSGSQAAPWIQGVGHAYVFTLYNYSGGSRGAVLGSVLVKSGSSNSSSSDSSSSSSVSVPGGSNFASAAPSIGCPSGLNLVWNVWYGAGCVVVYKPGDTRPVGCTDIGDVQWGGCQPQLGYTYLLPSNSAPSGDCSTDIPNSQHSNGEYAPMCGWIRSGAAFIWNGPGPNPGIIPNVSDLLYVCPAVAAVQAGAIPYVLEPGQQPRLATNVDMTQASFVAALKNQAASCAGQTTTAPDNSGGSGSTGGGGSSTVNPNKAPSSGATYVSSGTTGSPAGPTTPSSGTIGVGVGSTVDVMNATYKSVFGSTQSVVQNALNSFLGLPKGVNNTVAFGTQASVDSVASTNANTLSDLQHVPLNPNSVSGIGCYQFSTTMQLGDIDGEVRNLILALQADGENPAPLFTTSFDNIVQTAVIQFQEKYKADILTPSGLTAGTGIVGPATRAKLNSLCLVQMPTYTPIAANTTTSSSVVNFGQSFMGSTNGASQVNVAAIQAQIAALLTQVQQLQAQLNALKAQ